MCFAHLRFCPFPTHPRCRHQTCAMLLFRNQERLTNSHLPTSCVLLPATVLHYHEIHRLHSPFASTPGKIASPLLSFFPTTPLPAGNAGRSFTYEWSSPYYKHAGEPASGSKTMKQAHRRNPDFGVCSRWYLTECGRCFDGCPLMGGKIEPHCLFQIRTWGGGAFNCGGDTIEWYDITTEQPG